MCVVAPTPVSQVGIEAKSLLSGPPSGLAGLLVVWSGWVRCVFAREKGKAYIGNIERMIRFARMGSKIKLLSDINPWSPGKDLVCLLEVLGLLD